jgi:hypothetical protein
MHNIMPTILAAAKKAKKPPKKDAFWLNLIVIVLALSGG